VPTSTPPQPLPVGDGANQGPSGMWMIAALGSTIEATSVQCADFAHTLSGRVPASSQRERMETLTAILNASVRI